MKNRLISLLILFATVLFAGCENVEYLESSSPEEESENFYQQLENDLPSLNNGEDGEIIEQKFTIATDKKSIFYNEESNAGSISKAVEQRNTFLMDKYGANITVNEISADKLASQLKTAIESDSKYCDMIAIAAGETVSLYTAGLLADMNTLPDFSAESAYFDANNAKSLATNSTLYLLPDPTAQFYDDVYVYFFNRDLVNTVGGKDPESLVMQGKWTWDAFNEAARASAPAVYNKASADIAVDTFGFGAYYAEGTYPLVIWSSTGKKLIDNTYKNSIGLSMTVDEISSVAQGLVKYYNSRGKYPLDGNDAMNAFESGRLAFFCNKLSYFYALRDGTTSGSNYGFLPMPKLNEEQNGYYCLASTDARVFSVPKTIENESSERKRFVSVVIQATCAAGRQTINKAYLNHYIGTYLNNNAETVMLQTIMNSVTFDFATVYGSKISAIRRASTTAVADYLDFGSGLGNSIASGLPALNKYSEENFK